MEFNEKYADYIKLLRERLDDFRFEHSMAVARQAVVLAERFGEDKEKAYAAGLLHDICKNLKREEQLQFFSTSAIMLTETEKNSPKVWHAISGAQFLKDNLKITDQDIINAVRYHTTGRAGMSKLEKIIYIADLTGLDRTYPDVDVLRKIVEESLDEGLIYALKFTVTSLISKEQPIHPDTLNAYNDLIGSRK